MHILPKRKKYIYIASNGCHFNDLYVHVLNYVQCRKLAMYFCVNVIYVMDDYLFINSLLEKYQYQKLKIVILVNGNACQQNVIYVIVFSLHLCFL